METIFTMRSKALNSVVCFVILLMINVSSLNAQSFRLFAVSDLKRVFEDGYHMPPVTDTIKTFGIRGDKAEAFRNLGIFNQKQVMNLWEVNMFKNSPLFDNIREEPEFRKVLRDVESKYRTTHEKVRKWLEGQREL